MFDLVATRYDFINRVLALNLDMSWRKRLVQEVVGANGEIFQNDDDARILDLATGTADVAILLGKATAKYNSQSTTNDDSTTSTNTQPTVLGVDPSQNMLNVGNTKISSASLSNIITLQLGDSRNLSTISDNSFNAATMSFGIRNVPEKELALCEIHRVLKKKQTTSLSKLAIMEFSEPPENSGILGSIARLFIRHVVPAMGAMLSGHPKEYMHLQKSIKDFPTPDEFVKLMEGLRCPVTAEGGEEDASENESTFGTFRVKEVINLNFGSVQIYVANPILKKYVTE